MPTEYPKAELDRRRVRAGRHFTVEWAYIYDLERVRCFVYEVFGPADQLIYVGITGGFAGRWSAHLAKSWWIREAEITSVLLTGYETRADARMVEAALIEEKCPVYNTKPERKYLMIARTLGLAEWSLAAELSPSRWGLG